MKLLLILLTLAWQSGPNDHITIPVPEDVLEEKLLTINQDGTREWEPLNRWQERQREKRRAKDKNYKPTIVLLHPIGGKFAVVTAVCTQPGSQSVQILGITKGVRIIGRGRFTTTAYYQIKPGAVTRSTIGEFIRSRYHGWDISWHDGEIVPHSLTTNKASAPP